MNEHDNTPFTPENEDINNKSETNTSDGAFDEAQKAFKWEYTDENGTDEANADDTASDDPASSDDSEDTGEAEVTNAETVSEPSDNVDSKAEKSAKKRKDKALHLSCILSSCAIVLLLVFSFGLLTGLIPTGTQNKYPSSSLPPISTESEADPAVIEDFLNSVVIVVGKSTDSISTGTGVVYREDGYIITNYHVVEGCDTVTVELYGEGKAIKATVVGYHSEDDVAVLKINRTGLRAAKFVDSATVRYGEKVYAIGTPEGSDYGWSVTQGIVSCPDRQLMIYDSEGILEKKMHVVQTDASVNHGNSGGPIINVRGEVVGIVTLKRSDSAGMGFALPSSGVLVDANAIIKQGHANNVSSGISAPRPLVGVTGVGVIADTYYESEGNEEGSSIQVVDEAYAKANPNTTFYAAVTGVYVSATSAGSDAAKNLRHGDIITEINGNEVATIYDVMKVINKFDGGDTVTVKYYRGGSYYTVELTLRSAS